MKRECGQTLRFSAASLSDGSHLWLLVYEEGSMQSTELEEIKAALWLQAFHGCTQVQCPRGQGHGGLKEKGATSGSMSRARALV